MRLRRSFATVLLGAVIALAGSASLAVLGPPTALAASSSSAIFADCNAHPGGLTGHYTVAQLRTALQVMPPETKEYTSCPDVVNRALLAAIHPGKGGGGAGETAWPERARPGILRARRSTLGPWPQNARSR
jgi:hypothetical protein